MLGVTFMLYLLNFIGLDYQISFISCLTFDSRSNHLYLPFYGNNTKILLKIPIRDISLYFCSKFQDYFLLQKKKKKAILIVFSLERSRTSAWSIIYFRPVY